MSEPLALVLVFGAVFYGVWVLTPLLVEIGLERSEDRYRSKDGSKDDPIYRFTTPERLIQASWTMCIMGGGLITAILVVVGILNPLLLLCAMTGAGFVCFRLPGVWLKMRIKKRQRLFESRLVDLVVGLSNGLRSGAALPQSIEMVTRDIGGPVGQEFSLLLHEYRLGVDLPDGLAKLCRRMPSEDLMLMSTAVRVTMTAGGSLAEVLDKISTTIRDRTEFHEKLRTMTAQGRFEAIAMALAPLMAFGLLFLIDRELMIPLVTTKTGWTMLSIVFTLETVGFLIINKIVSVEV